MEPDAANNAITAVRPNTRLIMVYIIMVYVVFHSSYIFDLTRKYGGKLAYLDQCL